MNSPLVVAGNLVVDDIVYQDGKTALGQPGGAVLYAALGAALWGVPVGICSVVGDDYPEDTLTALHEKGIDLAGLRRVRGPGMRTWLLHEGRRRQVAHRLESPLHALMSPAVGDMPRSWSPSACHLAPMPLTIQCEWLDRFRNQPGVLLSLDPFDLVEEETLAPMRVLFNQADLVLLSEDELLLEGSLERPEQCLARITAPEYGGGRLKRIFLKRGSRGGLAYDCACRRCQSWRPHASEVIESTGAGDAFAGGLIAGLVRGFAPEAALERAVVSASFALEARGAQGLLGATLRVAADRYQQWFGKRPAT